MPDVNYQEASFYLKVAEWVAIGATAAWTYLRTKNNDNEKAIAALTKSVDGVNTRLAVLEERVAHMPNDEEIGQLSGQVASLQSQVDGVTGLLQRLERQTTLIHEHLLKNPK